jgi:hypothetical protein
MPHVAVSSRISQGMHRSGEMPQAEPALNQLFAHHLSSCSHSQWLGVSQECPLCKQSVLGKNDQSEAFAKATRRLAGGADLPSGPNDEETELAV